MSAGFLSKVKTNVADKLRTRFSSSEYVVRYNQYVTDDNWGPSAPDMDEIARMYPEGYYDLLPEMQLRLDNRDANWRRCYKTLLVIDHLARTLPENYIEDLRAFVPTLREISSQYNYTDSAGTDRGVSVRERAKKVADILHNDQQLREERDKAAKTRRAMQGVGCVDGVGSDAGKYGGFGSGGSAPATPPALGSAGFAGSVPTSSTAADRRKQFEEGDRRLAQALQDEEDARARVEARRRARGDAPPAAVVPSSSSRRTPAAATAHPAHGDDDFGELQAVETAAATAHHDDGDFGAFVDARQGAATTTTLAAPTAAAAAPAGPSLDDMFAAPAPSSKPAAPASIDDIFGPPASTYAPASPVVAPPASSGQVDLDIFAGSSTTLNNQPAANRRQPVW